jgi:hypothetical protein
MNSGACERYAVPASYNILLFWYFSQVCSLIIFYNQTECLRVIINTDQWRIPSKTIAWRMTRIVRMNVFTWIDLQVNRELIHRYGRKIVGFKGTRDSKIYTWYMVSMCTAKTKYQLKGIEQNLRIRIVKMTLVKYKIKQK